MAAARRKTTLWRFANCAPQRLLIVDTDMDLIRRDPHYRSDDIAEMFMMPATHNMPPSTTRLGSAQRGCRRGDFAGIQPDINGFYYPMTQPIKDAVNTVYQRLEGWQETAIVLRWKRAGGVKCVPIGRI